VAPGANPTLTNLAAAAFTMDPGLDMFRHFGFGSVDENDPDPEFQAARAAFTTEWDALPLDKPPRQLPAVKERENEVVHPRMWHLFQVLARACHRSLPAFNEQYYQTTTAEGRRPDLVVMLAPEQRMSLLAAAFICELKRVDESVDIYFRKAIAQLLTYMGQQREALRSTNTHAVGVVSDGLGLMVVCVDYQVEVTSTSDMYPIHLTGPMPLSTLPGDLALLRRARNNTRDPAYRAYLTQLVESPLDGSRVLLRLLGCSDRAPFGLPAEAQLPPNAAVELPGLQYVQHLGHGGFCVVNEVEYQGARAALRFSSPQAITSAWTGRARLWRSWRARECRASRACSARCLFPTAQTRRAACCWLRWASRCRRR
jgi:hypothetical protein